MLFTVIAPAGFCVLAAIKGASRALHLDLTITSACDGAHSGPDDPHHKGEAYDVRSQDLPDQATKARVLSCILGQLDPGRFFGFIEAAGTDNEHFHIQRKRGTTYTIEDFLV